MSDRDQILARRAKLVIAAVASLTAAVHCGDDADSSTSEVVSPQAGSGDSGGSKPQPCLSGAGGNPYSGAGQAGSGKGGAGQSGAGQAGAGQGGSTAGAAGAGAGGAGAGQGGSEQAGKGGSGQAGAGGTGQAGAGASGESGNSGQAGAAGEVQGGSGGSGQGGAGSGSGGAGSGGSGGSGGAGSGGAGGGSAGGTGGVGACCEAATGCGEGLVCAVPSPQFVGGCGDGQCNAGENCNLCPQDCGTCSATCNDGKCDAGESCASCPSDCAPCGPVCGDGKCDSESCETCPKDCGACPTEGVCKPKPEVFQCWTDADCNGAGFCVGVQLCGCGLVGCGGEQPGSCAVPGRPLRVEGRAQVAALARGEGWG